MEDSTLLTEHHVQNNITHLKSLTKAKPKWQERMLPVMAGMLIALTFFFFIATFIQMSYLHWNILNSPPIEVDPASGEALVTGSNSFNEIYQAHEFEVRTAMERYIIEKRYHQASVFLMSGLWLRYLGFITGMILALIGASFILGKLRDPEQQLEGKFSEVSLSIRTASPGIILAVLGVVLMFATLMDRDTYNVSDSNVYLLTNDLLNVSGNPNTMLPLPSEMIEPEDQSEGSQSNPSEVTPLLEAGPSVIDPLPTPSGDEP